MDKIEIKVGDYVKFKSSPTHISQGYVVLIKENGELQISDNGKLTCQNWVITEGEVLAVLVE